MNIVNILQKPIITEKTYKLMEINKYVFVVHPNARKEQIKIAFAKIFGVEVQDVNLFRMKPKKKRVGRFLGKKSGVKKAIITLKPGQKLNILQEEQAVDKVEPEKDKSIFNKFKKLFVSKKKVINEPDQKIITNNSKPKTTEEDKK